MSKIAIIQPNYIPWRGYFDIIKSVDKFILLDDVQYTKRDWRNRNLIKSSNGLQWLSIAVSNKGQYFQAINEVEITNKRWCVQHWKSLELNYAKAPFFEETKTWLQPIYESMLDTHTKLADINRIFLDVFCKKLAINTPISCSSSIDTSDKPSQRLVDICLHMKADTYVSGPQAQSYLDIDLFKRHNIEVEWFTYDGYAEYHQLWGRYEEKISIVDAFFNLGNNAIDALEKTR